MNRKTLLTGIALSALAMLSACKNAAAPVAMTPPPPVAVVPPPPPPPAQTGLSLTKCLNQTVVDRSLVNIVIPDQVVLDLQRPAGFPNGRQFQDQVIDLELAALFLDLTKHPVTIFTGIPVNPNQFDKPFRTVFPFYATPNGNPPLSPTTGTNFNFRPNPASDFVQLDRMGNPAIGTVTILSARKNAFSESNPTADAAGANTADILAGYQRFTDALNDDFKGLGLTPCAT